MHGDGDADAGIRARELLEDEDVGEEVGAGAAELRRNADAHQPELGELPVQLGGEAVLPVPGGRVRLDLGLRDLPRERLDLPLVGRELEVHRGRVYRPVGTGNFVFLSHKPLRAAWLGGTRELVLQKHKPF